MVAEFFRGRLPGAFAHCLYRRRYFEERSPRFLDEALTTCDVDVALHVMCKSKVYYLHEGLVWTRQHDETISTQELWRERVYYAEWLVQLHRYGPKALGKDEAEQLARRFKRYYLRRMLKWRLTDSDSGRVRRHLECLDLANARPTVSDYCDAVLDWPLVRLGLRPRWNSQPS
jgi:hypothetical protein